MTIGRNSKSIGAFPFELYSTDSKEAWESVGFRCEDNSIRLNECTIKLCQQTEGIKPGIIGWNWHGLDSSLQTLDSIPMKGARGGQSSSVPTSLPDQPVDEHPNTVYEIDHIVVKTADIHRTEEAFAAAGLVLKRRHIYKEKRLEQLFYKPRNTIIEVIASWRDESSAAGTGTSTVAAPDVGSNTSTTTLNNNTNANGGTDENMSPARNMYDSYIWGITFSCRDIDSLHESMPLTTKPPYAAIQKRRLFTTLASNKHDISLPLAFITPHEHVEKTPN